METDTKGIDTHTAYYYSDIIIIIREILSTQYSDHLVCCCSSVWIPEAHQMLLPHLCMVSLCKTIVCIALLLL